jgi:hypothetical protein
MSEETAVQEQPTAVATKATKATVKAEPVPDADNKTEKVTGLASALAGAVKAVSDTIAKRKSYSSVVEMVIGPQRVLVGTNMRNDSWESSLSQTADIAETAQEGAGEMVRALVSYATELVTLLTLPDIKPDADGKYAELSRGDALVETLKAVLLMVNADIFTVDENAIESSNLSIAAWGTVRAEYLTLGSASSRVAASNTGTRGPGALVEDHGFRLKYHCEVCNKDVRDGSHRSSAQNAFRVHYGNCHKVPAPKNGDPLHKGITEGIDSLLANPKTRDDRHLSVPGGSISREYV